MEIQIAGNIRKLRKEHAFTQEQLAQALGVSVGAVYKWESGQSMPEIRLLVEMAELFETSVDAILGYGWERGSMAQAAQRIRQYARDRQLEEGTRYAERAIQKYPNSFEVIYQSAKLYFVGLTPKSCQRAIALYREAIRLIDQNPYEDVNIVTIENDMAGAYCYIDKTDEAIALLKKNNWNGMNDAQIGLLLSQRKETAEEALTVLTQGLIGCHSTLYNICIGYANAYSATGELDQIRELMQVLYEFGQGLRDTGTVTYMDRGDVKIFLILAAVAVRQKDMESAQRYLAKARDIARRFDASPNYCLLNGKFCHGRQNATAYDDMGSTAQDIILNFLREEDCRDQLQPIWEDICDEAEK